MGPPPPDNNTPTDDNTTSMASGDYNNNSKDNTSCHLAAIRSNSPIEIIDLTGDSPSTSAKEVRDEPPLQVNPLDSDEGDSSNDTTTDINISLSDISSDSIESSDTEEIIKTKEE